MIAVVIGVIGYLMRRLEADFRDHIARVEKDIEKIETDRAERMRELYKEFVQKETFYMTVGEIKKMIADIFEEISKQSKCLNQVVGSLNERREKQE